MKRDIDASTEVGVALGRVREILTGDPGIAVTDQATAAERQERSFRTTLHVDLGGSGGLEQDVILQLGPGRSTDDALVIPISWQAAGRRRAFPTFEGELEAAGEGTGTRLVLRGTYRLPLGVLGGLGDRVAGRRAAHQSLVAFLEQVAGRLAKEARRRADTAPRAAPPYPRDLRDR